MSTLSLNCLLLNDDSTQFFTVKVPESDNVSILKKVIKEEKAPHLNHLAASDLILWKLGTPIPLSRRDGARAEINEKIRAVQTYLSIEAVEGNSHVQLLDSVEDVSDYWEDSPQPKHLHILVQKPSADIQAPVSSLPLPLLSLRCHLLGDQRNTFFTIEIQQTKDVSILKEMIKLKNSIQLTNFDARELILHNVSLSLADFETQFDTLKLESYPMLSDADKISTIFPNTSDDRRVHIVVDLPFENTSPSSRHALYSIDEENPSIFPREAVATAARKRDPPSTGAKNSTLRKTQKENQADAIYNGRPINLTAPPIEIYHPIFAKFRSGISGSIDKSSFTPNELRMVCDLVTSSLAFYENEDARIKDITTAMNALVDDQVLRRTEIVRDNGKTYKPDGAVFVQCEKFVKRDQAASAFTEGKNGIGEAGSDPIHQAQCDYVLYNSADDRRHIRDVCCCPAFLIGIAGPYMIISGAVFADRFISQHLTEYIFLGGTNLNSRLYEIARVLKTLKLCLNELKTFYRDLPPAPTVTRPSSVSRNQATSPRPLPGTPSRKTQGPSLFPHFSHFTANGKDFELKYVTRLVPHHSEKAVFKATVQHDGQSHAVVVKFTPTYCAHAHKVAHKMGSAPKLWFCDEVESVGMFVVVMEFVEGRRLDDDKPHLPEKVLAPLQEAISALHGEGLVHGDLRGPNVIVSEGSGGKCAMLLDFDWGGEEGKVYYPADINMQLTWHDDVEPGTLIRHEHDLFMLRCWASAGKTEC